VLDQLAALLLQYRAWASARPEAERQNKMGKLNEKYNEIAVREQEQGLPMVIDRTQSDNSSNQTISVRIMQTCW